MRHRNGPITRRVAGAQIAMPLIYCASPLFRRSFSLTRAVRAPILISYASKDPCVAGTVENAREPEKLRTAEGQPEDASPSNRSGPRRTRRRSDQGPIALCL